MNSKVIPVRYQLHLKFMLILSVFEKMLKAVKCFTQKNINITFLAVFLGRGRNAAYRFIEAILKEYGYCKKSNEKTF